MSGHEIVVRRQAPTDEAVFFPLEALQADFAEMSAKQIVTLRLLAGGIFNVNIRHLTSPETALVHARKADVWVVEEGSGVLVTGGTLVDPTPDPRESGDFSGSGIADGDACTIKVGDIIFIPPGVPHGVTEVHGKLTYMNIRFNTK